MKNTNTFLSYHQLLFPIILTEFLRRASLLPLEHTIEIGQIVEAAVIAHLCNSTRGIYEVLHPGIGALVALCCK